MHQRHPFFCDKGRSGGLPMNALDRFHSYVHHAEGCWEWRGRKLAKTGRAYFQHEGKRHIAARWLWSAMFGTIPNGQCVLHKCDNPSCVNPLHLFLGTQLDNIKDRDKKGRNRLRYNVCKNGHTLTVESVRLYGPGGKWRACRKCLADGMRRYREKLKTSSKGKP